MVLSNFNVLINPGILYINHLNVVPAAVSLASEKLSTLLKWIGKTSANLTFSKKVCLSLFLNKN